MEVLKEFLSDPSMATPACILLQCTLATGIAMLIVRCRPNHAAIRVTILRVAMWCAILCPIITMLLNAAQVSLIELPIALGRSSQPTATARIDSQEDSEIHRDQTQLIAQSHGDSLLGSASGELISTNLVLPESNAASVPNEPSVLERSTESESDETPPPSLIAETNHSEPVIELNREPKRSAFIGRPAGITSQTASRKLAYYFLALWVLGASIRGLGIVRSAWKIHRICRSSRELNDRRCRRIIEDVSSRLQVQNSLRLFESDRVSSPVAAGWRRPVVLMPTGLVSRLSSLEIEVVLLHEAAHILRRDQSSLLIERCFTALFWFHPLIHMFIGQLNRAREEVCDNYVLQSIDAPSFCEVLVHLTKLTSNQSPIRLSVGVFGSHWRLEKRISGLLSERRSVVTRSNLWLSGSVVCLISLCVVALGTARVTAQSDTLGQETKEPLVSQRLEQARADTQDEFVARVNGEVISKEELTAHVLESGQADALDSLINLRIIQQACVENGVVISEQDVEQSVKSTAEKFGLSVAEFYKLIENERDLTVERYHQQNVWPSLALQRLSQDGNIAEEFDRLLAEAQIEFGSQAYTPGNSDSAADDVLGNTGALSRSDRLRQGRPSRSAGRVAVVNLKRVLDEAGSFQTRVAELKSEVERAEEDMKRQAGEIESLSKALAAIPTENQEARVQLERLILEKKALIQRLRTEYRRDMLRSEAAIYVESYSEVQDVIRDYAKANEIQMVLRLNNDSNKQNLMESIDIDSVDTSDPTEVIKRINQPIIYAAEPESGPVDITDEIIELLNQSSRLQQRGN